MTTAIRVFLLAALIVGCDGSSGLQTQVSSEKEPQRVVVTSQPLLEMAQVVGQGIFEISKIVPEDVSSRDWKPRQEDIRTLQHAKLILISGAGYEPWKDRVSLPGSRLKDTAAGYYDQFIRIPDAVVHQHGPEGLHSHPGTVWATWLDPDLAMSQLSHVTSALVRISPEQKNAIETASAKLKAQLDSLNPLIAELAASSGNSPVTVISDGPLYQYLLNRLSWKTNYLHWSDSGDPSDQDQDELRALVKTLPESQPRIFLLHDRASTAAAEIATAAGFSVVRIDLCEFPVEPVVPFVDRMRANLTRLKTAVSPP
jgi:zinc transport system substrate-binding protein